MSGALKTHIDRLKADMAADKKKTGILAALFLILLVAVGRLFLPGDDTSSAAANTAVVAGNAALPQVDNSLTPVPPQTKGAPPVAVVPTQIPMTVKQPAKAVAASGKGAATPTKPFVKSMREAPAVNADVVSHLPRTLERNPFDASVWRQRFGVPTSPATAASNEKGAGSIFSALAQSLSTYQTERAQLTQQLDEELAKLELRSTMTGSRTSAYISGQLLHEGDEIAGFSVVRIEAGRVVLTKYGIQRTLSVP